MGVVRRFTTRHRWTDAEGQYLVASYSSKPWSEMEAHLGLSRRTICCKANLMGLQRHREPKRSAAEVREAKRAGMARKREADRDGARAYSKAYWAENRDRLNAKTRQATQDRLFWGRALRLRGVMPFDLWKLWKAQRGRCALSGRKMDRTAEVDHKLPKVRGGTDDLSNLQWTTKAANRAKCDMTDAEFRDLCRDCIEWIGERMLIVDAWD